MKRSEACNLLTKIASNELNDHEISKELFKARDVVVCAPNGILDVLATGEIRKHYAQVLRDYLYVFRNVEMISSNIRDSIVGLEIALKNGFDDDCECYLETRCKTCPNCKSGTIG